MSVWRDPWFCKIAWSFSHATYVIHQVHCSEEDRLASSLEAFLLELIDFLFLSVPIHCLAMQDQQHCLLNVLELLEDTGIDWKSLDSRNIEIFSSLLSPLPELISNHQVTVAKHRRTSLPALVDDVTVVDRSVASSRD